MDAYAKDCAHTMLGPTCDYALGELNINLYKCYIKVYALHRIYIFSRTEISLNSLLVFFYLICNSFPRVGIGS